MRVSSHFNWVAGPLLYRDFTLENPTVHHERVASCPDGTPFHSSKWDWNDKIPSKEENMRHARMVTVNIQLVPSFLLPSSFLLAFFSFFLSFFLPPPCPPRPTLRCGSDAGTNMHVRRSSSFTMHVVKFLQHVEQRLNKGWAKVDQSIEMKPAESSVDIYQRPRIETVKAHYTPHAIEVPSCQIQALTRLP